jgi:hypothetical protein
MSTSVRNKEIKVQRDAQSLDHFKNKVAGSEDVYVGILKPVLIGAGILAVALLAWAGFASMRSKAAERHEAALAEIVRYVEGDGVTPASAADTEKRMREKLPALEALAQSAPSAAKPVAAGMVSTWKLMLGQPSPAAPATLDATDPWQRLRLAQRSLALGKGDEASRLLAPLKKDASPQAPWGRSYWTVLMDCHRLLGDRDQALKDLAEYKERFKNLPDVDALDAVAKGI